MEILLVLQILVVVALVGVILLQRSSSDGFTGNSSPTSFMTGRAQANLFTKITAILATIFIINSLALAYIASHTERKDSIIEDIETTDGEAPTENSIDELNNKLQDLQTGSEEASSDNNAEANQDNSAVSAEEKINKGKEVTPSVPVAE
jgi:preprotein translocase subunit SecG